MTAQDRITATQITPGTHLTVERDPAGNLIPTRRQRGAFTVTATGKDVVTVENARQRFYVIHTTEGDTRPVSGAQTFTRAYLPADAPAAEVADQAPATVSAAPTCTNRGDHLPGTVGCPTYVKHCDGIPSDGRAVGETGRLVGSFPSAGETGTETIGRAVMVALTARHAVRDMRVGYSDPYGRGNVREFTAYAATVDGYAVTVTLYAGRTSGLAAEQTYAAIMVDGRVIREDGAMPAAMPPAQFGDLVARHFRYWLMDQPAGGHVNDARTRECAAPAHDPDPTEQERREAAARRLAARGEEIAAVAAARAEVPAVESIAVGTCSRCGIGTGALAGSGVVTCAHCDAPVSTHDEERLTTPYPFPAVTVAGETHAAGTYTGPAVDPLDVPALAGDVPAYPFPAVWSVPVTAGYGRVINPARRVEFRTEPVTVLGPVNFEPSMVRARRDGGAVVRAMREHITPVEVPVPVVEPAADPVDDVPALADWASLVAEVAATVADETDTGSAADPVHRAHPVTSGASCVAYANGTRTVPASDPVTFVDGDVTCADCLATYGKTAEELAKSGPWTLRTLPPGGNPNKPAEWRTGETFTDRAAATLAAMRLAAGRHVYGVEIKGADSMMVANWHAGDDIWSEWGRLGIDYGPGSGEFVAGARAALAEETHTAVAAAASTDAGDRHAWQLVTFDAATGTATAPAVTFDSFDLDAQRAVSRINGRPWNYTVCAYLVRVHAAATAVYRGLTPIDGEPVEPVAVIRHAGDDTDPDDTDGSGGTRPAVDPVDQGPTGGAITTPAPAATAHDCMAVAITHTAADGTVVDGLSFEGGRTAGIGKDCGTVGYGALWWNYSRNVGDGGAWYGRGTRDKRADRERIERLRHRLDISGYRVTVDIDDTLRPTAVVEADRAERTADRVDGLARAADKHEASASARLDAVRDGRAWVPGQPVMGAADAKRRAKLTEREDSAYREQEYAGTLAERSATSAAHAERMDRSDVVARRVERLEEDRRRAERNGQTQHVADLAEKIGHWTRVLLERAESGEWMAWEPRHFTACDPETWTGGDWVHNGIDWYPVLKVNRKSVTTPPIIYGGSRLNNAGLPWSWTDTQALTKIKARRRDGVITRHGGAADAQDNEPADLVADVPALADDTTEPADTAPADPTSSTTSTTETPGATMTTTTTSTTTSTAGETVGTDGVTGDRVREILAGARYDGRYLTGMPQLTRPEYDAVNVVLTGLGGTWKRGHGHAFPTDPADALAAFVAGGPVPRPERTTAGWVPTPAGVAGDVVAGLASLPAGARVLEPSAGAGALCAAILAAAPKVHITAVEPVAWRAESIGRNVPGVSAVVADTFEHWSDTDGLAGGKGRTFAAVVMNPPYAVDGDKSAWISHVRRGLAHLAPGGQLVAILPNSYTSRADKAHRALRTELSAMPGYRVDKLPADAFKASGVGVQTVAVYVTAPGGNPAPAAYIARTYTGAEVPAIVSTPQMDRKAARSMPVQLWRDAWCDAERVMRYVGDCFTPRCGRPVWAFDDGENDPRGVLGDAAADTIDACEFGESFGELTGPSVVQCFNHANEYETRNAAETYARTLWTLGEPERLLSDDQPDSGVFVDGVQVASVTHVDLTAPAAEVPAVVPAPAGIAAGTVHVVTVVNDARGNLEVHRVGCRDIDRKAAGGGSAWDVSTSDVRGVIADTYNDHEGFAEDGSNWREFAGDLTVMPCAPDLPDEAAAPRPLATVTPEPAPVLQSLPFGWSDLADLITGGTAPVSL